jgi:ATP-dependent RNA helicase DeaD
VDRPEDRVRSAITRPQGADRGRREPPRDEPGVRRERRPQKELSSWEPPAEKDDDAPLFREDGTKPGIGPASVPSEGAPAAAQPGDRPRGRRDARGAGPRPAARTRMVVDEDAGADAETIDISQPLPKYSIEDEPTIVFGGRLPKPRSAQVEQRAQEPSSDDIGPSSREQDDPAFTNVFLNVGRRDGLRNEDIQRLLVERAGLTESDVGHIRLRDRITFVGIRKEHADEAIKAVIGAVVGDRTVNAEVAKGR